MRATTALLELFTEKREWRQFFRSCCEMSTCRLMAQAWQFGDELKERGHPCSSEEVEDALLGLARDLLPERVAAGWDAEWAHDLCKDALSRLAEHYAVLSAEEIEALDLSVQTPWDERIVATGLDNDPAAFRAALKGWERGWKLSSRQERREVRHEGRELLLSIDTNWHTLAVRRTLEGRRRDVLHTAHDFLTAQGIRSDQPDRERDNARNGATCVPPLWSGVDGWTRPVPDHSPNSRRQITGD